MGEKSEGFNKRDDARQKRNVIAEKVEPTELDWDECERYNTSTERRR